MVLMSMLRFVRKGGVLVLIRRYGWTVVGSLTLLMSTGCGSVSGLKLQHILCDIGDTKTATIWDSSISRVRECFLLSVGSAGQRWFWGGVPGKDTTLNRQVAIKISAARAIPRPFVLLA